MISRPPLSIWRVLLNRTFEGLARLSERGQPVPNWTLGGGTALMLALGHRLSKDIDAFIDDPQYLGILDPDVGAEGVWPCIGSDRQGHYPKIVFPEGEIDFIAAGATTELPASIREVDGLTLAIQHPVEIAVSKMRHRPRTLKVRDIFDIAAVDQVHADSLAENLHRLSAMKADLLARLGDLSPSHYRAEMAEIDILRGWEGLPRTAFERVKAIIGSIP